MLCDSAQNLRSGYVLFGFYRSSTYYSTVIVVLIVCDIDVAGAGVLFGRISSFLGTGNYVSESVNVICVAVEEKKIAGTVVYYVFQLELDFVSYLVRRLVCRAAVRIICFENLLKIRIRVVNRAV